MSLFEILQPSLEINTHIGVYCIGLVSDIHHVSTLNFAENSMSHCRCRLVTMAACTSMHSWYHLVNLPSLVRVRCSRHLWSQRILYPRLIPSASLETRKKIKRFAFQIHSCSFCNRVATIQGKHGILLLQTGRTQCVKMQTRKIHGILL